MLSVRIDLLSGRYAATAYNDRDQVEWPPHPARLFSALVATWAEGEPGTADGDAELAALCWLEDQPAPHIVASEVAKSGTRTAMPVFVPVNDVGVIKAPDRSKLDAAERAVLEADTPQARAKATKQHTSLRDKLVADTMKETAVPAKFGKHDAAAAEQTLIERRARQPRTFPCATPEVPAFVFEWRDASPSGEVVEALSRLGRRLVRLGHSSSLVQARVSTGSVDELAAQATRFVPDDRDGDLMIRWVNAGQVQRLIRAHAQHQQVEPRVLPARFVRYREGEGRPDERAPQGVFDDELIIYVRESGPRLPITSVAGLSRQFRRALMSVAREPIAEVLAGHRPDGKPSEVPHLAVVPIPAVLGPYPEGAILGIALVLPRELAADDRRAVMQAMGRLEQAQASSDTDEPAVTLLLGDAGPLVLRRVAWGEEDRATLQPRTWTRPSMRWATATPIALDRNPGDLHDLDPIKRAEAFSIARALIVDAVRRIGLPSPTEVDVVRSCVLAGTAKPRSYPRFPSGTHKPQRVLVHARIGFAAAVRGPLLIGAGRYQGMGLCLPVERGPSEAM